MLDQTTVAMFNSEMEEAGKEEVQEEVLRS
jgi:hypothetical protein